MPGVDRSHIKGIAANDAATLEHRFKLYSWTAGVQYARFAETKCHKCRLTFLGPWQYRKPQGAWGHTIDCQFIGPLPADVFIVPRFRSFYAVDVALLVKITNDLVYNGGSFSSALLSWSGQHKERAQQSLILGEDLTMANHVREDLQVAWYAWNGARRAGNAVQSLRWEFTADGFENTLRALVPLVRAEHLRTIAEHVKSCPRCAGYLLVLVDGKHGARRFICAGLCGSVKYVDFRMALLTGCTEHAPQKSHFCKKCRPEKMMQTALIPQEKVIGVEPVTAEDGFSQDLRYLVVCKDFGADATGTFEALLPRTEVKPELLKEFEQGSLPKRTDHGNTKAKVPWVKGPRQLRRFFARSSDGCRQPVAEATPAHHKPTKIARKARPGFSKKAQRARQTKTKTSSSGVAKPKRRPNGSTSHATSLTKKTKQAQGVKEAAPRRAKANVPKASGWLADGCQRSENRWLD